MKIPYLLQLSVLTALTFTEIDNTAYSIAAKIPVQLSLAMSSDQLYNLDSGSWLARYYGIYRLRIISHIPLFLSYRNLLYKQYRRHIYSQ